MVPESLIRAAKLSVTGTSGELGEQAGAASGGGGRSSDCRRHPATHQAALSGTGHSMYEKHRIAAQIIDSLTSGALLGSSVADVDRKQRPRLPEAVVPFDDRKLTASEGVRLAMAACSFTRGACG